MRQKPMTAKRLKEISCHCKKGAMCWPTTAMELISEIKRLKEQAKLGMEKIK